MKQQLSINLHAKTLTALRRIAILEGRSLSEMGAILIEQRLDQLRQEYRQTPTLPSLPKPKETSTRLWDYECRELFGD